MTSGRATIIVPNVIGQDVNNARKHIENRELTFEIEKELYSDKVPEGSVISQIPLPKSFVKEGRFIYVTVSKGKELVSVPYINGQVIRNAKLNLMKVGLELGEVNYEFSESVGKDTIIYQSFSAGSKIPYGSQVSIIVSKGSELQLKVPMLIGLSEQEALDLISESGLLLGHTEYRQDNTFVPNIVIDQIPPPGTISGPQTTIRIVVSE
jgi:serine/threonine-protein kinase